MPFLLYTRLKSIIYSVWTAWIVCIDERPGGQAVKRSSKFTRTYSVSFSLSPSLALPIFSSVSEPWSPEKKCMHLNVQSVTHCCINNGLTFSIVKTSCQFFFSLFLFATLSFSNLFIHSIFLSITWAFLPHIHTNTLTRNSLSSYAIIVRMLFHQRLFCPFLFHFVSSAISLCMFFSLSLLYSSLIALPLNSIVAILSHNLT